MKIGFLGAGNVTRTIGRHLINAGHTIVVSNSRGPATLADFVADLGPAAIAGTREQAAECDIVVLATHWVNVPEALKGIDWRGRILIDAANAHMDPKTRHQSCGSYQIAGRVERAHIQRDSR
jgi:predicted dinucleotide-binding enzyme